ncbi:hypothetical protein AAFF_G00441060 [Aldrovandia affinis]|uniref:Uncharacterized protein n=1 Tax=Aldrovandia affinis TaxID=143900 RepID=A0AAD7WHL3_9TELE|nr:hypothetical protein AAFF_G00441060 [Aldrovandia affinis]
MWKWQDGGCGAGRDEVSRDGEEQEREAVSESRSHPCERILPCGACASAGKRRGRCRGAVSSEQQRSARTRHTGGSGGARSSAARIRSTSAKEQERHGEEQEQEQHGEEQEQGRSRGSDEEEQLGEEQGQDVFVHVGRLLCHSCFLPVDGHVQMRRGLVRGGGVAHSSVEKELPSRPPHRRSPHLGGPARDEEELGETR